MTKMQVIRKGIIEYLEQVGENSEFSGFKLLAYVRGVLLFYRMSAFDGTILKALREMRMDNIIDYVCLDTQASKYYLYKINRCFLKMHMKKLGLTEGGENV